MEMCTGRRGDSSPDGDWQPSRQRSFPGMDYPCFCCGVYPNLKLETDLEENIGDRPAWEPCRKNMANSSEEQQEGFYQKYMPSFRNEIWPAKRFLYFRFMITYIFYNQNWIIEFADNIDHLENFWPTPGPYIWRSMLVSLVSNISGCEISSNLLTESTFQDNVHIRRVDEVCGPRAALPQPRKSGSLQDHARKSEKNKRRPIEQQYWILWDSRYGRWWSRLWKL